MFQVNSYNSFFEYVLYYYEYITIYYEYNTILNSLPYDTHISLLFTGVVPFITNIILFITHYHLLRMTQGAGRNQRDPRVPDHHLKYTWVSTCRHLLRICSISTSPTPKCLWEGRPQWKEGLEVHLGEYIGCA